MTFKVDFIIESLKTISKHFSISLDELLSGEQLLSIAENDQKEKEKRVRDLFFGLLDCCMALLLFLPCFCQKTDGVIKIVSLLSLKGIQQYLKTVYIVFIILMIVVGISTLTLQNCQRKLWTQSKNILSITLNAGSVCLFIISLQPYPAIFSFAFLIIKALILLKRQ